jgi:uncharacterized protein YbjT (DUF2867 family)
MFRQEECGLPATILRPNYFMQNDASMKDAIAGHGVYPQPIGGKGVSMVDVRDIAEIAASCLLKRESAPEPLPRETIELVGPDALTGEGVVKIWSGLVGREVRYGGGDLSSYEKQLAAFVPAWMARDLRLMFAAFHEHGMAAKPEAVARMTELLGRPPRSYRDFAAETAKAWQS